jgi:endo-1,4-beta-mannosidase
MIKATLDSVQKIRGLAIEGKTRKTAMDFIQQSFKDPGIANFVASNLVYDEASERKFVKWCVNLDAIINNIDSIIGFDEGEPLKPYTGPSLFINGGLSVKHDETVYRRLFPECHIL